MKRFVECFSEHFETEFSRRRLSHQKPSNGTVNSGDDEPDYTDHTSTHAPKPTKPFFRRLSFKGLKKGKVIALVSFVVFQFVVFFIHNFPYSELQPW